MYRGHTKKEDSEREKSTTKLIKQNFGEDFVAKLKSNRRNGIRDYRKEQGPGSASLRRYIASKM